jgi:hypothetical protein
MAYYGMKKRDFKDVRKSMVFGLSPFHFFDNSISVSGEFFSPNYRKSVRLMLTGIFKDVPKLSDKGFALELSGRYYPKSFQCDSVMWGRNMASGIYLGYGAQAGFNEYMNQDRFFDNNGYPYDLEQTSIWVTPFVCFGYQFTLYEVLYIDIFVGGGIKFNNVSRSISGSSALSYSDYQENPNIFQREYKGILPKIGFTIGLGL